MNPVSRTYTNVTGAQTPVGLDYMPLSYTTIGVYVGAATTDFSVEFTLDDVNDSTVTARWFVLEDFPASTSANTYSMIPGPMLFVRINIEALSGSIELKVAQAVTPRA